MKKKSDKKGSMAKIVIVVVMAAVLTMGLGGIFSVPFASLSGDSGDAFVDDESVSTREIAMSCTLDLYTKFHIHPHLRIVIGGEERAIPANVGIDLLCMRPIHTHDTSGEIHVESPVERNFTLGDFFAVWDETFGKEQIFDHKADAERQIIMTVNGEPNEEYENLILREEQEIVIEYGPAVDAESE